METQATLVWTNGRVELYTVAEVDLHFTSVIDPRNTEGDDSFRFNESFEERYLLELGMLVINIFDTDEHFLDGLQIFFLAWMLCLQLRHELINV